MTTASAGPAATQRQSRKRAATSTRSGRSTKQTKQQLAEELDSVKAAADARIEAAEAAAKARIEAAEARAELRAQKAEMDRLIRKQRDLEEYCNPPANAEMERLLQKQRDLEACYAPPASTAPPAVHHHHHQPPPPPPPPPGSARYTECWPLASQEPPPSAQGQLQQFYRQDGPFAGAQASRAQPPVPQMHGLPPLLPRPSQGSVGYSGPQIGTSSAQPGRMDGRNNIWPVLQSLQQSVVLPAREQHPLAGQIGSAAQNRPPMPHYHQYPPR
ncbi:hypothetical protein B0T16DRAFT_13351 [Cercophora newfieldiana]|uniref:Uncharacterized protein n=1 Tax=Cercophora newfieldiana TaxID=92897 RepID=A0AA39YMY5_9PEZI|nr:hypothetical protein B0T16DRAFT_13351 [Cercophora newfieldiana]